MRGWVLLVALAAPMTGLAVERTPAPLPAAKAAKTAVLRDGFRHACLRRGAGRRAADLVLHRRPRPAVGGRGAQLRRLAANRQGSHRHPRGHRRRRQGRHAHGLLRRLQLRHRHRGRLRRRLGHVAAEALLHPRPRRRRQARRRSREVLFDGFGYKESRHNLANGFTWGPDGWLYAGHGRTSPSDVGRPGTPAGAAHPLRRRRLSHSSDAAASSRTSPTAPPTPGAWISTTSASASSPTASIRTCST